MDARIFRNAVGFASLAAAAFALTACPALAQQQPDTSQQSTGDAVADAARKAREEKKKDTPKPKKVYTDDDLNHSTSGNAPTSGGAAITQQGSGKDADAKRKDKADKAPDPGESAEARWRKQFKDAYASLDRAERELSVLEREDNKAQLQYYPDPQKALAEQYTRKDINEKDAKIAAKKKEIEQIKQRIDDMEDALRKSGGDPGWATP
jgi:hypothetical protein